MCHGGGKVLGEESVRKKKEKGLKEKTRPSNGVNVIREGI